MSMLSSAGDKLTRELVEYPIAASFACPLDSLDFNSNLSARDGAANTHVAVVLPVMCHFADDRRAAPLSKVTAHLTIQGSRAS
jgi:hypothetical protein